MTIKTIRDFKEFKSVSGQWNALLADSQSNILFLTHDWLTIWWSSFAKPDWKLLVILVYDADRLVGAAPFVEKKNVGNGPAKKTIEFLANSHTFRFDFIVSNKSDKKQVIETIWDQLQQEAKGWDLVKLKDLPTESGTTDILETVLAERGFSFSREELIETPYLPISGEWDAYFQKRSRNHRKNMRRAIRKLEEHGQMNLMAITDAGQIKDKIEKGLSIENSGWKGENSSSILSDESVSRFYRTLAEKLSDKGWVKLFFLKMDETDLAFDFCIIYEGRVYALKTAYDEKYAAFSPGQIMQMTELEYYFSDTVNEYDFIGPKMDFKMKWTDELREHWTLNIYGKTCRGALLGLWNMRILPVLRKSEFLRKLKS